MEELLKKAKELDITVAEGTTEEQLKTMIEASEQQLSISIEKEKKENKTKKNEEKKENKTKIRVIDNNNKQINEGIEDEKVKTLGVENKKTIHNKKLKQAMNGEYYEELSDGIGMWSRTGESFLLKDLDK